MTSTKKLYKQKARKAKTCFVCPASWEEGDEIYLVSDNLKVAMGDKSSFELVCLACGDRLQAAQTKKNDELATSTELKALFAEALVILQRLGAKLDELN